MTFTIAEGQPRPVPLTRVVDHVCDRFGVSREDLAGRGRHPIITLARQMIGAIARLRTTASFPEIAEVCAGGRGHSGVIASQRRLDRGEPVPDAFPMPFKTVGGVLDALVAELDQPGAVLRLERPKTHDEVVIAATRKLDRRIRTAMNDYTRETRI